MSRSLLSLLGAWIAVMAAAACGLWVLDRLPSALAGTPHRARVFASLADAERAAGARLALPGYYPQDLRWPPMRVETSAGSPVTVVVRIAGRSDGRERLVVVQSIGGRHSPPANLLPPGRPLETTDVTVAGAPAHLVRVLLDTRELHDLWWDRGDRRFTLRYTGPVDQLLLMAESLQRVRP